MKCFRQTLLPQGTYERMLRMISERKEYEEKVRSVVERDAESLKTIQKSIQNDPLKKLWEEITSSTRDDEDCDCISQLSEYHKQKVKEDTERRLQQEERTRKLRDERPSRKGYWRDVLSNLVISKSIDIGFNTILSFLLKI